MSVIPNQSILPTASPGKTPQSLRFGCRMFAYITPQTYTGQDQFLKQCLRDGGNSMKAQNQLPFAEVGDTSKTAKSHHQGQPDLTTKKAGWGLAAFVNQGKQAQQFFQKWHLPTWQDSRYDQAVNDLVDQHPNVVMAHLRDAHNHLPISQSNAHPFRVGDWNLMQHGDIPSDTTDYIKASLRRKALTAPGASLQPKGNTDTEQLACYLGERFRNLNPAAKGPNLGSVDTQTARAQIQSELAKVIRKGKPDLPLNQTDAYPGSFNIVLSEGRRLFATRYGTGVNLYLGTHIAPTGQVECVLATDKIQPTPKSGLSGITWRDIPHNTLLTLEQQPQADGTFKLIGWQETLVQDPRNPQPVAEPVDMAEFARSQLAPPLTEKSRKPGILNRLFAPIRMLQQTLTQWAQRLFAQIKSLWHRLTT